ncbi:MAG: HAD-IC family P-type ATPase [Pseudomonadota bacterium]
MKIHEVLSSGQVLTDFSAPPGKASELLLEWAAKSRVFSAAAAPWEEERPRQPHLVSAEGMAIFHTLTEWVKQPLLLLALAPPASVPQAISLAEGISPVRVLALLLSPIRESGTHIQLLSRLTMLLRNPRLQEDLLVARTPEEALRVVRREEESGGESYWVLSQRELFEELDTADQGLDDAEAARRLEETGHNIIRRQARQPLLQRFLANFVNLFALLLWAAAGLSYLGGLTELAGAIPVVILVNGVFSFFQEYRAERAVEALERLLPPKVRVIRGGRQEQIDATALVPGDILLLEAGDQIPADARLVSTQEFRVDNSVLTGESRPSYKFAEPVEDGRQFIWVDMPNLVFAGTAALSGEARGVVIATGMNTQLGHIAALTQAVREEPSPLQREMWHVARVVAAAAVGIGLLFFLIGLGGGRLTLAASLTFAVGLIVAFVPEGLLPTLSLSLAIGVQRMAAKNALVKKLSSVETLGAATVICSDKTGTLTTNQMMVYRLWLAGSDLMVTGSGYEPTGTLIHNGVPLGTQEMGSPLLGLVSRCAVLCGTTRLLPPAGEEAPWRVDGDPTEGALLVLAMKAGRDVGAIEAAYTRKRLLPFDPVRKRMTTINSEPDGTLTCWTKGAPDSLIPRCTHLALRDGTRKPLSPEDQAAAIGACNSFAGQGLRILALACRQADREDVSAEEAESGLTLIGIAGMIDPPRPEVPEAVARCHRAGLRVMMITGDYGPTAQAIARQIGLRLGKRFRLVTSERLATLPDVQLKAILRKGEAVFARSTPEDKLRIVRALREMGEIVAVTGDGVNDAPALKQASIGVAMGQRGTDVSREAAAMVLADDNFATIVSAVEEGRSVYDNIKKFITYVFASNLAEAVPFVLFVFMGIPLPLQVMQILAVDLGADLLPALALGAEPPEPGTMLRPPRGPRAHLIDWALARRSLFLGAVVASAGMAGYFFAYYADGWLPGEPLPASGLTYTRATTMCWAAIIAAQAGNALGLRTDRESLFTVGIFTNKLTWVGLASMVVVVLALSYVPALQNFFRTAPLRPTDLAFLLIFPPLALAAEELRKLVVRRTGRRGHGHGPAA